MSAHSPMRRAFLFALLLLAASAVSALAATVEPVQAHRRASSYSHRFRHSISRSTVKRSPTSSRSRTAGRATMHPAHYASGHISTAHTYSRPRYGIRNQRHFAGRKSGYDAGRAAALREIAARQAELHLSSRPAEVSRTTEVASLRQPVVPQPASPQPASHTAYDAVSRDRQPTASSFSGAPGPYRSTPDRPILDSSTPDSATPGSPTHAPSAGETAELPFTHSPAAGNSASQLAQPAARAAPAASDGAANSSDQPESAVTARELTHDNVESDAPPPNEVAVLHLPAAGMPSSLRGSLASLERQNSMLESEGLERILDESDLSSRIEHGLLVPVPISADLTVNPNLIENHRYCRPWTARFLTDLSRAHAAAFHRPLEVNSAVRTVEYQTHLMRVNSNAAAAEGDIVSPHLTGATIDIAKQGMTHAELVWMRRRLLAIQDAGKIDVEEEFRQACFHITVYKTYSPASSHKPAARDAANQHKAAPASSLPSAIAAGALVPQGR